jgi:hypothetical protein
MSADDYSELVALPGAPDLVFDISGTRIAAWSKIEGSFILRLSGGRGWWLDDDDVAVDVETMADCEIQATIFDAWSIDWLTGAFTRWSSSSSQLRLTAATGRLARLAAANGDWVCLPFTPYPIGRAS